MKIYIVLILCLSSFITIFSQSNFEIEASEGFVFFDYFGDEPEGFDKVFAGYGLQSEFDVWKKFNISKPLKFRIGIGYTNFRYLYDYGTNFFAKDEITTSYFNLKFGLNYKPNWSKIYFITNFTNYFLPYKEKQQDSQNRWFSVLDLGLRIKIINKFKLIVCTPVTLYPMHEGKLVALPINLDFDPFIEITGISLGLSYNL